MFLLPSNNNSRSVETYVTNREEAFINQDGYCILKRKFSPLLNSARKCLIFSQSEDQNDALAENWAFPFRSGACHWLPAVEPRREHACVWLVPQQRHLLNPHLLVPPAQDVVPHAGSGGKKLLLYLLSNLTDRYWGRRPWYDALQEASSCGRVHSVSDKRGRKEWLGVCLTWWLLFKCLIVLPTLCTSQMFWHRPHGSVPLDWALWELQRSTLGKLALGSPEQPSSGR